MFRWLAAECDRRGIWLVQQFYSIIVSQPFAKKHGLEAQLSASTPLVDDYMRKSIAEFVRQFPHVGLMPCLGEALQNQAAQTRWLTEVILPGVKDGMAAAGLTTEPPVVLRTHATDATIVSQNQEDGAQPAPNGTKKIVWKANPQTKEAPLAVLQLTPLP